MGQLKRQQIGRRESGLVGLKVAAAISECVANANKLDEFLWGFETRIKEMKSGNHSRVESFYKADRLSDKVEIWKLDMYGVKKRILFEVFESKVTEV